MIATAPPTSIEQVSFTKYETMATYRVDIAGQEDAPSF